MPLSRLLQRAALAAALLVSLPLLAAQPYHLELEASPAGPFPYLGRFGDVELHVYAGGVRAEALWLDSFSRNGSDSVTVLNPLGRVYVDVPVREIAPILEKLSGQLDAQQRATTPTVAKPIKGKVGTLNATRHRLVYGRAAWIDVWTTLAVPENPQLRRIVNAMLEGIAPGTAKAAARFEGTPVYVELNFRRFKKFQLLKLKKLTMNAGDEASALKRGPMYVRAALLEKLLEP